MTRGMLAKIECQARFAEVSPMFILAKVLNKPMKDFFPPGFGDPPRR